MNNKEQSSLERFSHSATAWIGSTQSLAVHTVLFVISSILVPIVGFDRVLLVVTTVVSLEAIYMNIFIQMTVNRQGVHIQDIREDVEDIQEDVEDLSEEDKDEIDKSII